MLHPRRSKIQQSLVTCVAGAVAEPGLGPAVLHGEAGITVQRTVKRLLHLLGRPGQVMNLCAWLEAGKRSPESKIKG